MMGEVSEERRLADAGLAADLEQHPGVERREGGRELDLAIEQAANQAGAKQDRRRPGTQVGPLGSHGLAKGGAVRFANLQDKTANCNVADDRIVWHPWGLG